MWHSGGHIDEQINGCYGTLPWMDHQRRLLTHCWTLRVATSCILPVITEHVSFKQWVVCMTVYSFGVVSHSDKNETLNSLIITINSTICYGIPSLPYDFSMNTFSSWQIRAGRKFLSETVVVVQCGGENG